MSITKDKMKNSLKDKSSIWLTFSRTNYPKAKDSFHCFFEGEDRKYYIDRIEQFTSFKSEEIIGYDCKGKKAVIDVYKKIISTQKYSSSALGFFVDRDYELDEKIEDSILYQTAYHSLENCYVVLSAFKDIVNKEFGINTIDEDFEKVINDYKDRIDEFRNIVAYINTFIICFQKLGGQLVLEKFNLSDFLDIGIESIQVKMDISLEEIKKYYLSKLTKDLEMNKKYSQENYDNFCSIISKVEEIFNDELLVVQTCLNTKIHGKMELYFFKKIIEDLKRLNKINKYFTHKRDCIYIEEQSKNILSNLSKYAETPNCLIAFLENLGSEKLQKYQFAN
ncbi:DUF4435 domain-containing protein [Lysinibacillus capsici]|uniref:DUF4435 domain-containing protein n=1 Tax=Lysinibacillus capsici TaxID=2115968 RepID=UPI003D706DDC